MYGTSQNLRPSVRNWLLLTPPSFIGAPPPPKRDGAPCQAGPQEIQLALTTCDISEASFQRKRENQQNLPGFSALAGKARRARAARSRAPAAPRAKYGAGPLEAGKQLSSTVSLRNQIIGPSIPRGGHQVSQLLPHLPARRVRMPHGPAPCAQRPGRGGGCTRMLRAGPTANMVQPRARP